LSAINAVHNDFEYPPPACQESAQIPGFWNPMVNGATGIFSDQKSSPTRGWVCAHRAIFLLPVMRINLQVLDVSGGMIVLWLNRVYLETRELNPRSSIFYQRKSQLHHLPLDSRNQESALPLDSRNQESAQIPGFWNPMVNGATGIFSDHIL
jgi:hypothetical protein